MSCVNWYQKLGEEGEDVEDWEGNGLGPAASNVDFKIGEDVFEKWGERVPRNFYDSNKLESTQYILEGAKNGRFEGYK
jgi:hypothetical protein